MTDFDDAVCEGTIYENTIHAEHESTSMIKSHQELEDELVDDLLDEESSSGPTEVHPLDWDCPEKLKLLIEGALFASQEPVSAKAIQALFPELARPNLKEIESALDELEQEYSERAVSLHQSPLGYRFQVRQAATPLIKSMLTEKSPKYSRASLETLALIAYRQPITRGEIEEVRGVSVSSHIMRSMEERGWVRVVGHKELPGRPALWATTPEFLVYFGLNSLEDLPPLAQIRSLDQDINDAKEPSLVQKNVIIEEQLEEKDQNLTSEVEKLQVSTDESMSCSEKQPSSPIHQLQEIDYQSVFQRLREKDKESH